MTTPLTNAELRKLVVDWKQQWDELVGRSPHRDNGRLNALYQAAVAIESAPETNEPYIITRRNLDAAVHEYAAVASSGEWRWSSEPFEPVPLDYPIVVRDKPKPPTLEEVLVAIWSGAAIGGDAVQDAADAIREHFTVTPKAEP